MSLGPCIFCGRNVVVSTEENKYCTKYRHETVYGFTTCLCANGNSKDGKKYKDKSGNQLLATPVSDQKTWSCNSNKSKLNEWLGDVEIIAKLGILPTQPAQPEMLKCVHCGCKIEQASLAALAETATFDNPLRWYRHVLDNGVRFWMCEYVYANPKGGHTTTAEAPLGTLWEGDYPEWYKKSSVNPVKEPVTKLIKPRKKRVHKIYCGTCGLEIKEDSNPTVLPYYHVSNGALLCDAANDVFHKYMVDDIHCVAHIKKDVVAKVAVTYQTERKIQEWNKNGDLVFEHFGITSIAGRKFKNE
jgi:hypothetical protein